MKWLGKLFNKKKTLRDKLIEMYGAEAGVYYDKINQGIPIGGLLETIVFLHMVKETKKITSEGITMNIFNKIFNKKKNKVHFYVTKDKDGVLILWFGKPKRAILSELWYGYDEVNWITDRVDDFHLYNLNPKDFDNLKWEDEPVEVFVNMKD